MLEVQTAGTENYLPTTAPKVDGDETITFEAGELKYFVAEIKEMIENKEIIDIGKAIHNAKYFAEISRRIADVKAGKNVVSFSDEEWEKFVNAQDIS